MVQLDPNVNNLSSPEPSTRPEPEARFIFFDTRGKRWPRFKRVSFVVGSLVFVGIVLFVQSLILPSQLHLPPAVQQLKTRLKALQFKDYQSRQKTTKPLWQDFDKQATARRHPAAAHSPSGTSGVPHLHNGPSQPVPEIRLGFFESWDPDALDSLKAHAHQLTHLCTDWLSFGDGASLKLAEAEDAASFVKKARLTPIPILRNLSHDDIWQPERIEHLINGPPAGQEQFLADLVDALQRLEAGGVLLDWQQIDPAYREALTTFLEKTASRLHASELELWISVPTGKELDLLDLDSLAEHVDHFVAMLHDENAESDQPGPVASREYFNGWLTTLIEDYGQPSQWVISLGSYGYDWQEGAAEAEHISFADAMSRAGRANLTTCDFDAPSFNPHYVYEDSRVLHTVWFLDGITFFNQLAAVRAKLAGGFAVMRLGMEDPAIWDVMAMNTAASPGPKDMAQLGRIIPGDTIARIGKGNLITVIDERQDGNRLVVQDNRAGLERGLSGQYEVFPRYLTVVHQGEGPPDSVTLTFDDGPDPDWTPALLDILKEKKVKATFFMLGANMEKHPDLVQRIVAEGHMIGVHTYTHPNIAEVSEERARLEFNATQRLIESITGTSTVLFRPPYNADTNPHEAEELVPVKLAQTMGYMTVTEDIDPEDWARPGVDAMLEVIKTGRQQGGTVVLLHDAGGNREQTVQALPSIIDYLRNRGDVLLPLPELLGIPAAELMPVLPDTQQPLIRMISESGFTILHTTTGFFWAFMIVATGLTIIKTLIVGWLAIRSRRQGNASSQSAVFSPAVSVLMAAYNEEKVIAETLHSVLASTYPGEMEVVVVDDGSTDRTGALVAALAAQDPRIRLISQANRGKARALQAGMEALQYGIVISLDADTQFTPDTIAALVAPLADPAVGAVSGRARVGNARTLFAKFQSLEYTCGFNLDRRAYGQLNCITVVPGAVSALRMTSLKEIGGISTETLAEDTDLTLTLHRYGYTVAYAPEAVAWTEAPETVQAFAKQRFRWAFGTLQCLWKHRDLLFAIRQGALGLFSLPSTWFFNIVLVATGSLIDILLLCSLIISPANHILYVYFFVFLAADLLLAAVACWIEKEPLRQVWLILPMRFLYRPVLNYVVIKAVLRALKGVWVGWGKLDRTASVNLQGLKGKA